MAGELTLAEVRLKGHTPTPPNYHPYQVSTSYT